MKKLLFQCATNCIIASALLLFGCSNVSRETIDKETPSDPQPICLKTEIEYHDFYLVCTGQTSETCTNSGDWEDEGHCFATNTKPIDDGRCVKSDDEKICVDNYRIQHCKIPYEHCSEYSSFSSKS